MIYIISDMTIVSRTAVKKKEIKKAESERETVAELAARYYSPLLATLNAFQLLLL